MISLQDAQALLQKHRLVSLYHIKLKDGTPVERLRKRVARRYPDLTLSTCSEFADKQQMVAMMKGFGLAVAALAVVVGGVGMMNTVLMSVYERTREIGVLRALGWRQRRVLRMILSESFLLALMGGLVGSGLGILTVRAMGSRPTYGLLRGRFSPDLFTQAFGVALVLGVTGGFYPAWRAARLQPIEAIQREGGLSTDLGYGLGRLGGMTWRSLWRRRTRTLLTIVGIGIGIAAVVAIGGLYQGFITQFTAMATGSRAELMAIEADASDMGYSAIDERVGKRLAALPEIQHVSGIALSVVSSMKSMPFFIVLGYHPRQVAIQHFKVVEGGPLTANRQILLGRRAADILGKGVGDTIWLNKAAFRVVGIFETGVAGEESGGVISLREAQRLLGKPRQVSMYAIELRDPGRVEAVRRYLREHFSEIDISMTAEFAENLPDMKTTQSSVGGITFLVALVGSVGMMNTVLMSVYERTREIGVLRALGWRRGRVLRMILKESLLLSGISGLVGIALGIGLGKALGLIASVAAFVQTTFTWQLFAQAMIASLVLGVLGGLYPAWWAAKLAPVEALRYE